MTGSGMSMSESMNLLRKTWRTLCSLRVTVILLCAVLLVSLLGTLFPQRTYEIQAQDVAHAQWVAAVQDRYGALSDVLGRLGLLGVYSSPLFLTLFAALVANGIACTVSRLGPIWRTITAVPSAVRPDGFYERATNHALLKISSRDEARRKAITLLSRKRYRPLAEERERLTYICGQKNRFARTGTLITHSALVLIALGVLWTTRSAWREPAVILGPGQLYDVGHGHRFQVRHEGFEVERYADGSAKDYRSHVCVLVEGSEVMRKTIRVNDPLTYEGVSFYLSSSGPALLVEGRDGDARPLPLRLSPAEPPTQGETVLNFSAHGDAKSVYLTSLGVRLDVTLRARGAAEDPSIFVEAFETGQDEPLLSYYVNPGDTLHLLDASLRFTPDRYSVLQVVSDPGFAPVIVASLLGMGGLLITLYFYPSRIWGKLSDGELLLAGSADRNQARFKTDFDKLVAKLEKELR